MLNAYDKADMDRDIEAFGLLIGKPDPGTWTSIELIRWSLFTGIWEAPSTRVAA